MLDGGHDLPELRQLVRQGSDRGETAAGTILRLRQRVIPVCAREVDAVSA